MEYELVENINERHAAAFRAAYDAGYRRFDFMGGRRSGKSYFIEQFLLSRVASGQVVNVATMTDTQGRLGAYADVCDILHDSPNFASFLEVTKSPKEVRQKNGQGRMFFNSYQMGERAKGIACDWLWMNEGNNFTEQQYVDLSASARLGVFVDRNPNSECFTERNNFALLHSDWTWNKEYLTAEQRAWFDALKAKAESPDATQADIAFYKMYYLGEYAEMSGSIFTPANLLRIDKPTPGELTHIRIYADPSALVGSDYFASVLTGISNGYLVLIDAHSSNCCGREDIINVWRDWCEQYDVEGLNVETNGYIGQEFYKYARTVFSQLKPYNNGANKVDRILANYANITERMRFADTQAVADYLQQVFAFAGKKSEHDDNIDAINSAWEIAHTYLRVI